MPTKKTILVPKFHTDRIETGSYFGVSFEQAQNLLGSSQDLSRTGCSLRPTCKRVRTGRERATALRCAMLKLNVKIVYNNFN